MPAKRSRKLRAAAPLADTVADTLRNGRAFGITKVSCIRMAGAQGKKQVKIRRDGNGGLLVSSTEPGGRREFAVSSVDPQDTITLLGKHFVSLGIAVSYR